MNMNRFGTILFTGIVMGDVFLLRETSDLFIGLVLILYALMHKRMKRPGVTAINVSMASLIFMYISFLRHQHNTTTERFAVWTVIFLLASLVVQCMEFSKHRKTNSHKSYD